MSGCTASGGKAPASDPDAPPGEAAAARRADFEAYFQQLQLLVDQYVAAGGAAAAPFSQPAADLGADPSDRAVLDYAAGLYAALVPGMEAYVAGVEALQPPDAIASEHKRYLGLLEDQLDELKDTADRFASAESASDVRDLLQIPGDDLYAYLGNLAEDLAPCFDLQQIGLDRGFDVNLHCSPLAEEEPADDGVSPIIMRKPEFQTPVAVVRGAGVTPYWLGDRLEINGGETFLNQIADDEDHTGVGPAFALDYSGRDGDGTLLYFWLDTYAEATSAADTAWQATRQAGAEASAVQVGEWPGQVVLVPGAGQPVATLFLFVDVGDMIVVAQAQAGTTGVPGQDANAAFDSTLLIDLLAEYLRPFEE